MRYETHHLLPEPLVDLLVQASGGDRAGVVASIPYGGRPIIVRASARLLDGHDYAQKTEVWPCPRRVFALESYTSNFSPHLGEEMGFTVAIPGCLHERDPGWIEAEIMRETTAGWQHVAWVDMDAGKAGVQEKFFSHTLKLFY